MLITSNSTHFRKVQLICYCRSCWTSPVHNCCCFVSRRRNHTHCWSLFKSILRVQISSHNTDWNKGADKLNFAVQIRSINVGLGLENVSDFWKVKWPPDQTVLTVGITNSKKLSLLSCDFLCNRATTALLPSVWKWHRSLLTWSFFWSCCFVLWIWCRARRVSRRCRSGVRISFSRFSAGVPAKKMECFRHREQKEDYKAVGVGTKSRLFLSCHFAQQGVQKCGTLVLWSRLQATSLTLAVKVGSVNKAAITIGQGTSISHTSAAHVQLFPKSSVPEYKCWMLSELPISQHDIQVTNKQIYHHRAHHQLFHFATWAFQANHIQISCKPSMLVRYWPNSTGVTRTCHSWKAVPHMKRCCFSRGMQKTK